MVTENTLIIGIENREGVNIYKLLHYSYIEGMWNFKRLMASGPQILRLLWDKKLTLRNAGLQGGKIVGTTGSLDRFKVSKGNVPPMVIISEVVDNAGEVLGYKVCNNSGEVKTIPIKNVLDICKSIQNASLIPFQNAVYVKGDKDKKAHLRAFVEGDFVKEVVQRKKSSFARPAVVKETEAAKNLAKLEEMFTPEQIVELQLGKKHGVNIKIYGNNKLSPTQMAIIRKALEEGLDPRPFASPEFSPQTMRLYLADLRYGVDISKYINPKYNADQLNEVSMGYISGIDVSSYADPKIPAEEMAERRMRLESGIWTTHKVTSDSSWGDK